MQQRFISYQKCVEYIQEGDILLFRGDTVISYLLQAANESQYSHVGIAGKDSQGNWECVEMKEFYGGRSVPLLEYLQRWSGRIDVYRPISPARIMQVNYVDQKLITNESLVYYDGALVVACMREVNKLSYGWKRIGWMAKRHVPFARLFFRVTPDTFDDELIDTWNKVCSTLVSHCIRKCWADLIKNRSDARMEPGDISKSPLIQYLFTPVLQPEGDSI